MELIYVIPLVVFALLAFLAMRVPVGFALALSGVLGLALAGHAGLVLSTLGSVPFSTVATQTFVVVPMYIFIGVVAEQLRIPEDVFAAVNRVARRVPGHLGIAALAACAGFAAVSGSSVATVASVGRVAVREMVRHGYSKVFAAGIVGASGTLASLIPPSIPLVVYGIIAEEPIGRLLIAGIVPGIISAVLYGFFIIYRARRSPALIGRTRDGRPITPAAASDELVTPVLTRRQPVAGIARLLIIFGVVVGGIYTGLFTATEAGALGGVLAVVLLWVRPGTPLRGSVRASWDAMKDAAATTSVIFMIVVGASIFTFFFVLTGTPAAIANALIALNAPGHLVVAAILLAIVPLGMFLDPISILLITTPLVYPIVTGFGFDGIWWGIMMIKQIELSLITPPVGLNAYVVSGVVEGLPVEKAFAGVLPFALVDAATIVLFFVFPGIILWLPNLI